MTTWNPGQYLKFSDERTRPFRDLIAHVPLDAPARIVDLGCGPGNGTPALRATWPDASIEGVDSSESMIARATADNTGPDGAPLDPAVSYRVGDLVDWRPLEPVDLLVSNATLQWVPGHRAILTRLADLVAPGGVFAFQVPGNFRAPAHTILADLATSDPYDAYTPSTTDRTSADPADYLADLSRPGWSVDAWETTYLHVLRGEDPVFEFIAGTHARPVIESLPAGLAAEFTTEYRRRLREAFPQAADGTTVLPFRRVFVVASRTA
ncbi:methyltransferase domain-containing protein [Plantibacter sp. Mn2098]|uniref:methyltransferase domain-containing protein n=1 Tax=Plantibacter sp. Mn2098 TaxID=3395266 RepID=UPI003BE3256D